MNSRILAVLASALLVLAGCTERVVIKTTPPGAYVYVNDRLIGKSPVVFGAKRGDMSLPYKVRIEKEGYTTIDDALLTRVAWGRVVFGYGFTLGILALFRGTHYFVPVDYGLEPASASPDAERNRFIGESMRHIQKLYDDGKISKEERDQRLQELLETK